MGSPPPPAAENSVAQQQIDGDSSNGVSAAVEEKKPDLPNPSIEDLDKFEDIDKYKKYEADYTYRLMAKYFSEKDIRGGNIFDEQVTIDGEIIKASRWPSTSSYVDPLSVFNDISCCGISISEAEEATTISNGKQPLKK
ncbi:hypothetical protein CRG98_009225 [Punica granatum]|uniref:Uncharacterized protein n=1 Tax=Punica granatum TaxID=22663 RepID=A0A2I0KPC6_PUNGR|nr:hypothetical protein CRG98_009225 [Punica granatum]